MSELPSVEIIWEEGPCLVVCKPSGLLTQAPSSIDSMEARLREFIRQRDFKRGKVYLGVPHRLDRPVSGALLFAKNQRAAKRLAEQFESRTVHKTYWACVSGTVEPNEGTWIDHMRKVPDEPRAELISPDAPDARQAVLHYRTLGNTPFGSWLEIELETGRMHQIRLQCASRLHAILGDAQYGSQIPFGEPPADPRLQPIALHARTLSFSHPMTHLPVSLTAPLPQLWQTLGIQENG